jgi:N utilization substance protein B
VEKQAIRGRRRARRLSVQALYQWLMSNHELYEIEMQFRVANKMENVDVDYFCKILYGVPANLATLEAGITPYLDRAIKALNPVELSVLRLGAFELSFCPEIPYRVILEEAVLLTKEFGSQDGHRYVNGVLNKFARHVRFTEINLSNG